MNYIIEKLAETEQQDRGKRADHLLTVFEDGGVPQGGWAPGCDWPSMNEVDKELRGQEEFFNELETLVGSQTETMRVAKERFQSNAKQMLKLTSMDSSERRELPAHEFFPLYGKFSESFQCERGRSVIDSSKLHFTTELLGKGGYSNVYKAVHDDGTVYAAKLYRLPHQVAKFERCDGFFNRTVDYLMENVRQNFDFLSQEPFARPVLVPSGCHEWYVLEHSSGKSVKSLIEEDVLDGKDLGRILLTYAQMLVRLHEDQRCFVDNNWGAVMLEPDRVRIIDYDAIASWDSLQKREGAKFRVARYASREHEVDELPLNRSSDLESFALMIDDLFIGSPFLYNPSWKTKDRRAHWKRADTNRRNYPKERSDKLPHALADVVQALIRYPRDDTMTADDLVQAINRDFEQNDTDLVIRM